MVSNKLQELESQDLLTKKAEYLERLERLEYQQTKRTPDETLERLADTYCKVRKFKTFEEYFNAHIGQEWWR